MSEPGGMLFVLSAPSGTGKTTLMKRLTEEFPNVIRGVSYTTRPKREDEVDGVDYHFISKKAFEQMRKSGDFLESVQFSDAFYGTSREWVEKKRGEGKHVVLVIETRGGMNVRRQIPETVLIFLKPPSLEVLKERLEGRKTESAESISKRLEIAKKELESASDYDFHVVNDNLEDAYQKLRRIIKEKIHETG